MDAKDSGIASLTGIKAFADPFNDDWLSVAGRSSEPSSPLTITIDTTAPLFTSGSTAAAIDENSGAGQLVYTAEASDPSAVRYSLKAGAGDSDSFSINLDSGAVTLSADPDYESQSTFNFTVVATDAAGNSTEQSVSLAINDQPETGPSLDAIAEYGQASVNHGWSRITLSNS